MLLSSVLMPYSKRINAYQHVSDYVRGRILAYQDLVILFRNISSRFDQTLLTLTVCKISNQWIQESLTEAILEPNGLLSLTAEKTDILLVWL